VLTAPQYIQHRVLLLSGALQINVKWVMMISYRERKLRFKPRQSVSALSTEPMFQQFNIQPSLPWRLGHCVAVMELDIFIPSKDMEYSNDMPR
jgi:hypothetical protein